jgi:hypothetical protein
MSDDNTTEQIATLQLQAELARLRLELAEAKAENAQLRQAAAQQKNSPAAAAADSHHTFSTHPNHRHIDLDVTPNGLVVTKARTERQQGNVWSTILSSQSYAAGKHYREFKLASARGSNMMVHIAVQPKAVVEGNAKSPAYFLPRSDTRRAKGVEAASKWYYFNRIVHPTGLGAFGAGDQVGVLLDLSPSAATAALDSSLPHEVLDPEEQQRGTVTFSVNGKAGLAMPLAGDSYYFSVSLFSKDDFVELLPTQCWDA